MHAVRKVLVRGRMLLAAVAVVAGVGWSVTPALAAAPPTLTAPADGSFTADATPTFSGQGGPVDETFSTVTVRVWLETTDSAPVAELTTIAQPDRSFTVDATSALAPGTYLASAGQQDANTNEVAESNLVTFTVDTLAPAVALTSPADSSSSTDATPDLAGTAGTGPGDLTGVTIDIWRDAVAGDPLHEVAATTGAGGAFAATGPALAPGTYVAIARQADEAGNVGTSPATTFTITAPSAGGGGGGGGGGGAAPTAVTPPTGGTATAPSSGGGDAPAVTPQPLTPSTTVTRVRIGATLRSAVDAWRARRPARIARLLDDGLRLRFVAPAAGDLRVRLFATVDGKRIRVAAGRASATGPGPIAVTVTPTKAGRRVLGQAKRRVTVVLVAAFAPTGEQAVKRRGTLRLTPSQR